MVNTLLPRLGNHSHFLLWFDKFGLPSKEGVVSIRIYRKEVNEKRLGENLCNKTGN